jgi:hypothetical protein
MVRRSLVTLLVVAAFAPVLLPQAGAAATAPAYKVDAFLKLCGVNTGCLIDPLPHPWVGNNIYNTTGYRQKVHHRLDNGRGIRFWITFQNEGGQTDTYSLQGCKGNKNFQILQVLIGKYKVPMGVDATHIDDQFKHNTWTFTLKPGGHIAITLNILTYDPSDSGLSYRCPMTVTSQGDPTQQDTVIAAMTMY